MREHSIEIRTDNNRNLRAAICAGDVIEIEIEGKDFAKLWLTKTEAIELSEFLKSVSRSK